MNQTGTFLLGVIAAIVLFMLWKKETGNAGIFGQASGSSSVGGCSGMAGGCGCGGTCDASSPVAQGLMALAGTDGQISPGTPPLNTVAGGQGATSFFTNSGVTPDTSFAFVPTNRNLSSVGSPVQPPQGRTGGNTTSAGRTPIRATQQVPNFNEQGFVHRFNVVGVPLAAGARNYIQ